MNEKTRVSNVMRNMKVGLVIQILSPILAFINRTVFIAVLGKEYLGINGLYSNILSVLALADLGLYTAMLYSLYKPIAENNQREVAGLVNFFKVVYRVVALVVTLIGVCLVPFLQHIVKGSALELRQLRLYFLLYLANTVCSYLVVYKTTLLKADQRIYITKTTDFITKVLTEILQIVILVCTHNYLLFLCINAVVVLIKNLVTSKIADRIYPYLKTEKGTIAPEVKKQLVSNVKATFLYKLSNIVINSTDNILISMLLGVVVVGRYSNYLQIVTIINTFVMLLAESVLASLGNFNATQGEDAKHKLFRSLLFAFFLVATFCASCFAGMFNDFIRFWVGHMDPEYVLSDFTVYVISFNFFITCSTSPLWLFRETAGIFNQVKYAMAISALLNIIFSVVLGNILGLPGILLATSLANLCSNYWYEPMVLYKNLFGRSVKAYWSYLLKLAGVSLICVVSCAALGKVFSGSLVTAMIKIVIGGVVTAGAYWCMFHKSEEYQYLLSRVVSRVFKK